MRNKAAQCFLNIERLCCIRHFSYSKNNVLFTDLTI